MITNQCAVTFLGIRSYISFVESEIYGETKVPVSPEESRNDGLFQNWTAWFLVSLA